VAAQHTTGADVLDCSRSLTAVFWLAIGAALALFVMRSTGQNWASLLRVGSESPARPKIERELGPVVSPDVRGHDGQIYYLIARDPFGAGDTAALLAGFDTNPPRYRYRRILYPLLAGGFGHFSGRGTLFGMIALVTLGMALAAAAIADLTFQLGLKGGTAFAAIFNLGALLGAMMLTADVLALGLALAGIALAMRRRTWGAIVFLALAALTKDIYLLVAISVAAWEWWNRRRSSGIAIAAGAVLPLLLWSAAVATFIPDAPVKAPPFGLPFAGMFHSIPLWTTRQAGNGGEMVFAGYVAVTFVLAAVGAAVGRGQALRFVPPLWIAIAICSTPISVWDIPSNVARQFAILWPVGVLLVTRAMRVSEPARCGCRSSLR